MKKIILLLTGIALCISASAQKVAIKNNLLYDAALTPNLGLELAIGEKTSLDISGNYNDFKLSNDKMWKHWLVQPEFRFWTCDRFNGSFWGIHAMGGEYNWANLHLPFGVAKGLRDHRYEGWYVGGGISYGYQWVLSNRWSLEATIGVGYMHIYHEKYECGDCSPRLSKGHTNYFGPTKLGLSFLFFL